MGILVKIRYRLFFILVVSCLFSACRDQAAFDKNVNISQDGWPMEEVVTINVPILDTLSHYAIFVNLRHNDSYLYDNIFLEVSATSPKGAKVIDTLEYRLADARGKWEGKKGGQWYDYILPFRSDIQFVGKGDYLFEIRYLMRQQALPGIGSVGLRLVKIESGY